MCNDRNNRPVQRVRVNEENAVYLIVIIQGFSDMSKTKQNIPKSKRGGYDLWGKRPISGFGIGAWAKKMCRRVERRMRRKLIAEELESEEL